jgi:hypothetical protein
MVEPAIGLKKQHRIEMNWYIIIVLGALAVSIFSRQVNFFSSHETLTLEILFVFSR